MIFVQIDGDPLSVGEGWTVDGRRVVAAYVDFVGDNLRAMYPDDEVTVVAGARATCESDMPDVEESMGGLLAFFWEEFLEHGCEGYDLR